MITISLCMIVKNEEAVLARCLDSVGDLADEIIVVDTGSTDRTIEIARSYTDRIFHFPWRDDFAAARNYAFDQAHMEYCLWLDADDVLEPPDRERFRRLKEALPPDTDMVMLPYHAAFDDHGNPTFTYDRERLIRRAAGLRWSGAVHEAIAPTGVVRHGDAAVSHRKTGPGDPDRNLRILEKLRAARPLEPRECFYYARELTYHNRDKEAAAAFEQFLRDGRGWYVDCVQACMDLAECRKRMGQRDLVLPALCAGLRYAPPSSELCCAIGQALMDEKRWQAAAYWYTQALERPVGEGFVTPDCHHYIPMLQLCVCAYHMGDVEKAVQWNDAAAEIHPDSAVCAQNRAFFQGL